MSTRLRPWATLRYAGAILRTLFRRKITGDLLFLYASFFASFVLPLLTIPYLTRVLGKHAWGQLVFVQGFCLLLGVPLAWGFGFHGTRLIARHRDDRVKVGTICSEITMARIFLLLPVGLILILCVITIPGLHSDLRLPLVGFAAVAINSFSPSWILQGLDQMRFSSALDLTTKLIASLPVFLLVSSPDHAFVVFLLQACGGLVALVPGYRAVCLQVQLRLGFTRSPLAVCRESSGMFLFSLSGAFVNQANVFVFGLFAPMQAVGIYAGAEKIIRAATALVGPFSTALHTKINYRIAGDRAGAARLFVRGTAVLFVMAALGSAVIWFASDMIVARLLGAEFHESARVLRMLSFLPLINWMSYSINLNWLIVLGLDRLLNSCVFFAAAIALVSSCLLVPLFSVTGMGLSVLLAEAALLAALVAVMIQTKQNPLKIAFPSDRDSSDKGT